MVSTTSLVAVSLTDGDTVKKYTADAPDLTYTAQVNITLGGKRVEVIPIPTDHAPDNTIPTGFRRLISSSGVSNGTISE